MAPSLRHGTARALAACALVAFVAAAMSLAAAAQDKKACQLCFAPADSAVFHYKISSYTEQDYYGVSATLTQTADVILTNSGKTEAGDTKIDLTFKKITSSLVSNNQLMDWDPPVNLEGKTVRATVSRKGKVVEVQALGSIPGIGGSGDLLEIVEPWFIRLPDTAFAVGDKWTREILASAKEGEEPERSGKALYTLKKLEKKGAIDVAVIEAKITVKLNAVTEAGRLVGYEKTDLKALVAIGSGHIVEIKRVVEVKGDVFSRDPLTNKETKQQTTVVTTYEGKLQN